VLTPRAVKLIAISSVATARMRFTVTTSSNRISLGASKGMLRMLIVVFIFGFPSVLRTALMVLS
jgi:hypothetical protein